MAVAIAVAIADDNVASGLQTDMAVYNLLVRRECAALDNPPPAVKLPPTTNFPINHTRLNQPDSTRLINQVDSRKEKVATNTSHLPSAASACTRAPCIGAPQPAWMDLLSRTGGQPLVQDGMERTRDLAGDLPAAAAKHYSQVEVFSVGRPAYEAEVQMPPVLVPEPAAAAIKPPSRQNSARMWIDEMLENTTATHGAAATSQSPVQLFSALGRARSLAPQLPVTPTLPPIHGNGHVQMEELLKDVLGGEDSANPPKTQDTEDALNAMMQDLGAAMQGPSQPPFPAAKASPFGANQTIGTQVHWQDDPVGVVRSGCTGRP
eukprot:359469-Chlamydomonas_euryale.AAC.9